MRTGTQGHPYLNNGAYSAPLRLLARGRPPHSSCFFYGWFVFLSMFVSGSTLLSGGWQPPPALTPRPHKHTSLWIGQRTRRQMMRSRIHEKGNLRSPAPHMRAIRHPIVVYVLTRIGKTSTPGIQSRLLSGYHSAQNTLVIY